MRKELDQLLLRLSGVNHCLHDESTGGDERIALTEPSQGRIKDLSPIRGESKRSGPVYLRRLTA
jgi:hypothetical protein